MSRSQSSSGSLAPDGAAAPRGSGAPLGRTSCPYSRPWHIPVPLAPDPRDATASELQGQVFDRTPWKQQQPGLPMAGRKQPKHVHRSACKTWRTVGVWQRTGMSALASPHMDVRSSGHDPHGPSRLGPKLRCPGSAGSRCATARLDPTPLHHGPTQRTAQPPPPPGLPWMPPLARTAGSSNGASVFAGRPVTSIATSSTGRPSR